MLCHSANEKLVLNEYNICLNACMHVLGMHPTGNNMFKVNNRNTRTRSEICPKVNNKGTRTTPMALLRCLYC